MAAVTPLSCPILYYLILSYPILSYILYSVRLLLMDSRWLCYSLENAAANHHFRLNSDFYLICISDKSLDIPILDLVCLLVCLFALSLFLIYSQENIEHNVAHVALSSLMEATEASWWLLGECE